MSTSTESVWMATARVPQFPALEQSFTADVCVVGAGIAGLTTAYLLAAQGVRVAVLERAAIGAGETSRTTAHLSFALDSLYCGSEGASPAWRARRVAESHATAVDLIESIVRREQIPADLQRLDGYLFVPPGESLEVLDREFDTLRTAGIDCVSRHDRAPIASFDTGPCLRFPRQAQLHPVKYISGLARAIAARGGRIHAGAHVCRVSGGSDAFVETTDGHRVSAQAIVVATNSPIHTNLQIHSKQSPYRTYVIGAAVPAGAVPLALYWDTADPFHYVRLHRSGEQDILIVGGEDHRAGDDDDGRARFDALEEWTRARFPIGDVRYRWSGQVMESADGVGLIGRDELDEPNVYFVTGDSGLGMTHGTIAGMLLSDLVAGRENGWRDVYNPGRLPVSSIDFYRENLEVIWHLGEWFTSGDRGTVEAINPGEGAIVRSGLSKIAVYRSDDNEVTAMSAVCPHLGCIVSWNSTEQQWHCPCHGSRFDCRGHVLNGPAKDGLRIVR